MSRAATLIALLATFGALAGANKIRHNNEHYVENEESFIDYEPLVYPHSTPIKPCVAYASDEMLLEELRFRGLLLGFGPTEVGGRGELGGSGSKDLFNGAGSGPIIGDDLPAVLHGGQPGSSGFNMPASSGGHSGLQIKGGPGHRTKKWPRRHGLVPARNPAPHPPGVLPFANHIPASAHLSSHNLAEASKSGIVAGEKHFSAGRHEENRNENEGLRKHSVFNNDKTIIKDRNSGVNDLESFRNSNGHSEGSHISGGAGQLAAESAVGRIEKDKELDLEIGSS